MIAGHFIDYTVLRLIIKQEETVHTDLKLQIKDPFLFQLMEASLVFPVVSQ
jgi:hypothetical protein